MTPLTIDWLLSASLCFVSPTASIAVTTAAARGGRDTGGRCSEGALGTSVGSFCTNPHPRLETRIPSFPPGDSEGFYNVRCGLFRSERIGAVEFVSLAADPVHNTKKPLRGRNNSPRLPSERTALPYARKGCPRSTPFQRVSRDRTAL